MVRLELIEAGIPEVPTKGGLLLEIVLQYWLRLKIKSQ